MALVSNKTKQKFQTRQRINTADLTELGFFGYIPVNDPGIADYRSQTEKENS